MARIGAKDVIKGNIPDVNYLIVTDKGMADDFAKAINSLTSLGWSVEHIWAAQTFHFALFKRKQKKWSRPWDLHPSKMDLQSIASASPPDRLDCRDILQSRFKDVGKIGL